MFVFYGVMEERKKILVLAYLRISAGEIGDNLGGYTFPFLDFEDKCFSINMRGKT